MFVVRYDKQLILKCIRCNKEETIDTEGLSSAQVRRLYRDNWGLLDEAPYNSTCGMGVALCTLCAAEYFNWVDNMYAELKDVYNIY